MEICTCAGRSPGKGFCEHTWASLRRPSKPPIAPQRCPLISNVTHHWYNFGSLIYGRCLANRYFIQSSQTANHPPRRPPCPALSERKPRTHLLTSKGMMFSGFTEGISGQSYRLWGTIQLSSVLPVVHRYRADVSLGRFATPDWLTTISCSLWFFFRRERCIMLLASKYLICLKLKWI